MSAAIGQVSNRDEARLNRALGLSYTSECKQRHGALIYKSNSLIAQGINSSRVHNAYLKGYTEKPATFHAEERAIRNAQALVGDDLSGMVIYVARSFKNGEPAYSAPCSKCHELIVRSGIKKVVYTVGEFNE